MKDIAKELEKYGIKDVHTIYHNLSYDELFKHETDPSLEGFEKGYETSLGAVSVDTGIFTGRSPKDKYIVRESNTKHNIWWADPEKGGSDNKPITKEVWNDLYEISSKQLSGKKLYVTDAFCGANENTRLKIRVITEVAWMSHFVRNMFITPTDEELKNFEPDFVMLNACKTVNHKWEEHKLNSDVYVAFNLTEKLAVVGGTWYGGEIKKGMFSVMNYFLPLQGIASMHCSANMGKNGDTALFFGLSGTGKTTLSADPDRFLIGDDEHGWDNEGVFNFEGGCYAKCIDLSEEKEPDIFKAIRRDALLENVVFDEETGVIDFKDNSKTENTRVSYPINHIKNIVKPISKGGHPKNIIFLTADAFGVLPPVAKLTKDQTMYYFLSGYTSKLAGTERGIKEPLPVFSSAFGAAFLLLHPTVYAQELARKMEEHGSNAYLVNTGWIGGPYGVGNRIDLGATRSIIKAILDGSLENAEYEELPTFGLQIPKHVDGLDSEILNPANTWKYKSQYVTQAQILADKFIANFEKFSDKEEGKRLVAAGPRNKQMKEFYSYYEGKIKTINDDHKKEISKLRDQIYILQNSFNEYISFNSINTNYKNYPINRYLPVTAYINTNGTDELDKAYASFKMMIQTAGFEFYSADKTLSNYSERITVSKERISMYDLQSIITDIENAFRNKLVNSEELSLAVSEFKNVTENIPNIMFKLGSLLIVKTKNHENKDEFKSVRLSTSALIHIDKHPDLLTDPENIIKELKFFLGHNYMD